MIVASNVRPHAVRGGGKRTTEALTATSRQHALDELDKNVKAARKAFRSGVWSRMAP